MANGRIQHEVWRCHCVNQSQSVRLQLSGHNRHEVVQCSAKKLYNILEIVDSGGNNEISEPRVLGIGENGIFV